MIPVAEPFIGDEELKNVIEAVESGWISSIGKFVPEFEKDFAKYCGAKDGIATSNGTAALHLALASLGIKKGDEVIVPTLTFVATANAIAYCNARPVFVDSCPEYWCIDPEKIEEKITDATKAIIPVHLYGHPCNMAAILNIARDHDLYVIEDAAEAHGAEYNGKKVGASGDIGCFSFYGNKIITTGEGGMCTTNNEELAERMRFLRDHGMHPEKRYWHEVVGFNYRMTNVQAAIGVAQLERIDYIIEKKREIARWYAKYLGGVVGVVLHPEMSWAKNVYWMYSILVESGRDDLMKKLKEEGIDTRPFFYPLHQLPPHQRDEGFQVADRLAREGVNLPSSPTIDEETVRYVSEKITTAF